MKVKIDSYKFILVEKNQLKYSDINEVYHEK